jgi:hypothetical protein
MFKEVVQEYFSEVIYCLSASLPINIGLFLDDKGTHFWAVTGALMCVRAAIKAR